MFMYVHAMEQTSPTHPALLVPDAAALVGVRDFELREAIASGDLNHSYRIAVNADDVRAWHAERTLS